MNEKLSQELNEALPPGTFVFEYNLHYKIKIELQLH